MYFHLVLFVCTSSSFLRCIDNHYYTAHSDCQAALDRFIDESFLIVKVLMEPEDGGHLLVEPYRPTSITEDDREDDVF